MAIFPYCNKNLPNCSSNPAERYHSVAFLKCSTSTGGILCVYIFFLFFLRAAFHSMLFIRIGIHMWHISSPEYEKSAGKERETAEMNHWIHIILETNSACM